LYPCWPGQKLVQKKMTKRIDAERNLIWELTAFAPPPTATGLCDYLNRLQRILKRAAKYSSWLQLSTQSRDPQMRADYTDFDLGALCLVLCADQFSHPPFCTSRKALSTKLQVQNLRMSSSVDNVLSSTGLIETRVSHARLLCIDPTVARWYRRET
jgi:hypothetical protein